MPSRSATEEDLAKIGTIILGTPWWPAAEKAGLVAVGGFWMRPEHVERFKEAHRKKNAETRAWLEKKRSEKALAEGQTAPPDGGQGEE